MRSQGTAAHYTIHHEISRHGCILYNTPRDLKALQRVIKYPTNSQDPDAYYTTHKPRAVKTLLHIPTASVQAY